MSQPKPMIINFLRALPLSHYPVIFPFCDFYQSLEKNTAKNSTKA